MNQFKYSEPQTFYVKTLHGKRFLKMGEKSEKSEKSETNCKKLHNNLAKKAVSKKRCKRIIAKIVQFTFEITIHF